MTVNSAIYLRKHSIKALKKCIFISFVIHFYSVIFAYKIENFPMGNLLSFNCQFFCYVKYRWRSRACGPFEIKWQHLIKTMNLKSRTAIYLLCNIYYKKLKLAQQMICYSLTAKVFFLEEIKNMYLSKYVARFCNLAL